MHVLAVVQLLILLTLANGSPVIARLILREHFSSPLDFGCTFIDGKPLFGPSKTVRGALIAIIVTGVGAALLGLGSAIGVLIGSAAMVGDLLSSFLKRRLGWPASSKATGLDQIPESLLPVLASRQAFSLSTVEILVVCAIFFGGEILLSRLLYRFHVRERPY
jgi:uncharacterized membrane protein YczE